MGFGTIKKQPSGKYRVWWSSGGKRHSKVLGTSRKEAQIFLAHKKIECQGIDYCITYDTYWDTVVVPTFYNLAENTKHNYHVAWNTLSPMIGGQPISSTTYRTAEMALAKIESPSLQKKCYNVWKKVCNMAVRDRLIAFNPIDRTIRLNKIHHMPKVLYERDDVLEMLDVIKGTKFEALFILEVGGGLRHEEASAICGRDITVRESEDALYASVSVNKALVCVAGRKYLKETKNDNSERLVLIGEPFASRLIEIASENQTPLTYGMVRGDGSKEDHYRSPAVSSTIWKRFCEKNGLKYVTYQNMRATYATLLGEAEAIDSLVSMAMGHSGSSTKGKHYQKSTLKGLEIVADAYTDYLLSDA